MDDLVEKIREMMGDTDAAKQHSDDAPPADGGDIAAMLTGLLPLVSGLTQDDDSTALLRALRPYMHGGREKRLDDAIRLMQLLKFVPLLQGKGGLFTHE